VERAVVVVMMRLFLQMQDDMRNAIAVILYEAHTRDRERMPQERNHEHENERRFAHVGNLTETR
jgi:hypothetical protein